MPKRPCWVEISTDSLANNYRILAEGCAGEGASPVELLAIVKADAYGHGLALCAPAAVRAGARWLGVTSVEEGAAARGYCDEAGFRDVQILVIGGAFPGQGGAAIAHRLTPVVWDAWQLEELEGAARAADCAAGSVAVHLELDTGMSRQGVGAGELDAVLERFGEGSRLRLTGLMTHLYAADESDGAVTRGQFALLERMAARVFGAGFRPEWLHVGNSAAVLAGEALEELRAVCGRFGMRAMARPGLALYGLAPEFLPEEPLAVREVRGRLRRVLEWKTRVVSLLSVEAGGVVGYNGTFMATEPMRLALLAVGYADGLRRELSNRGRVLVRGQRAPIVGRISMDQTVVDVTEIPGVVAQDEVVLLGWEGGEEITAEEHARWAATIPWEIFTGIAARVARHRIGEVGGY
jgi:alanine racemase